MAFVIVTKSAIPGWFDQNQREFGDFDTLTDAIDWATDEAELKTEDYSIRHIP